MFYNIQTIPSLTVVRFLSEVDYHSKHQLESMEMTVRAKHKEVELLKLAIEQRDAEIERLTELTRYTRISCDLNIRCNEHAIS